MLTALIRPEAMACAGFLVALALPTQVRAQEVREAEIRAVVEQLFDGMREGDSTAVRSAFHPEARLMTSALREGELRLQTSSIDDFVRAVGTPHDEVWDERVDGLEIRMDDPLATAWMRYRFHLGETPSHCGVNSMQLVRTPAGWKILHIVDTRRVACED